MRRLRSVFRLVALGACFAWLAALGQACGPRAAADPFDDARHLRVGLDPRGEADAIEARLVAQGFERVARVDAPSAVGLAMRGEEGATVLRIVTRRGVALAVDAPMESLSRSEVGLIAAPPDLDGDGFVELLPAATDLARSRRCFAIVRVLEDGALVEVSPASPHGEGCLVGTVDLQSDGRPEVVGKVRFAELAWEGVPEVAVVFGVVPGASESFPGARWGEVVAPGFYDDEARARRRLLVQARADGRSGDAYRLGVELAAIAWLRGEPAGAQVRELREAIEGMASSEATTRRVLDASAFIDRGWRDAEVDEPPSS